MAELIFEIGCEEMPARFIPKAMASLRELAAEELTGQGLLPENTNDFLVLGAPRRLAIIIKNLNPIQPDREEIILGPPLKSAHDANGAPSKAALGFAKSLNIEVSALEEIESEKGPRLGLRKQTQGRPALDILSEVLPQLITRISFPKTMRWGSYKSRFARPVHWLLAILDGQVIPFEFAGIKTNAITYGHRFMAPAPLEITKAEDYLLKLRKAYVLADRQERKQETMRQVEMAAQNARGRLVPDPELLEEVADLVEWPIACCGSFDEDFLKVPRAVIISAMREHQRYFALEDRDGNLLPNFVAVNNTQALDPQVVTKGHERVLRARLADASFFVREDVKTPLLDRLQSLKEVTYHFKLGTSFEKVERFTALAVCLAQKLGLDQPEIDRLILASRLAKCDLVTGLVGEFPTLQGMVGEEYALRQGQDPRVAQAIREHYMPQQAGGDLPLGQLGMLIGLADRFDTICGCFSVGLIPTGTADPYGLRRAAIAIIRIITEKNLTLSLNEILDQALAGLKDKAERPAMEVKKDVLAFIAGRLVSILGDHNVPVDVAEAVVAAGLDDLQAAKARALALTAFKESEDFAPLVAGLKRVRNILRKEADQVPTTLPDPGKFAEPAEKALWQAYQSLAQRADSLFQAGQYEEFLRQLATLRQPIDHFFDQVMVMAEDTNLRLNRLATLNQIDKIFAQLAQFSLLQLTQSPANP